MWVNASHGCDFHPLANHMTKLKKLPRVSFQRFYFQLTMFDQAISNLIVCLMISPKLRYIQKLHKRVSMLQWILDRFEFLQNEFELSRHLSVVKYSTSPSFNIKNVVTFKCFNSQCTKFSFMKIHCKNFKAKVYFAPKFNALGVITF